MSQKSRRYYIRGQTVPFEEDMLHEFKGHRNIAAEDLPPWTQETKTSKASRRAASRAINAFLNTGKGGTVYLGVLDSGIVRGMQLTQYQKDHMVGSLDDVMFRYTPQVKQHRYKMTFVPVVGTDLEGQNSTDETNFDASERAREHQFRCHNYCWCDKDSVAKYNAGVMMPDYVIEIHLKPWDPADVRNLGDGCGSLVNLHQIHEDEEGNCYFRRQASLVAYTMTELAQLTRQEVRETCLRKIDSLKDEILHLQQLDKT